MLLKFINKFTNIQAMQFFRPIVDIINSWMPFIKIFPIMRRQSLATRLLELISVF